MIGRVPLNPAIFFCLEADQVLIRDSKYAPSSANNASGDHTANPADKRPFKPNCSKKLVDPIKSSHIPTAAPIVTILPFLLRLRAKGAEKKAITRGRNGVE